MSNGSALFISTLNEIEALGKIFSQIPFSEFDEVYALDGGSTDGTIQFFIDRGIPVVHNIKKGEIFNVGAMLTICEHIVWFAPDGNEDPKDIVPLLQIIRDEGYDMGNASRFGPNARNEEDDQWFRLRSRVNQIFSWIVRLRWGGDIYDAINGFRSCKRSKLFAMALEPTGFDIEFQMTIRGLKLGHRVKEIPTIEGNRLGGKSTAYSFPTGWLMLKRLFKELFTGVSSIDGNRLRSQADMDNLKISFPGQS